MWSNKANEFPLHNPKLPQNRNSTRDLTTEWDAFSQTKAALQHIENKLEVAPISIAGLESVMEKKPSISTTRKISRKDCRSSSQNKESCFRKPLRVTTLDSNVSKNGHVEFRQPLASFRDSRWSPSCKTSCQLEDKRLKYKEAGNKAEGIGMIYDKGEPDLHGRDLKSSSSTDETVVRYLNDHPAINALQSSDVVNPTKLEEEKSEESRGDEYTKISPSSIIQNEPKELQLVESSTSSASTSSAHRLDILKQHQHDDKLEKLKERIRKQWECPEELTTRGHDPEYSDYPITVAAPENIVTPKVRKVATAPMAPSYKGFNPSEAKIRTPDGKVWCEEEFLNLSRELCRDLEFQLAEEDLPAIKIPTERKQKKGHKPVRKTQKIAQLSSPYFKSDGANTISTTSWRDGQRLAKKILGPVPKLEQSNTQILSSDRSEKDKFIKSVSSAQITETDCNMPVAVKPLTKCPERSWSKIRAKNNLKKKDAAPHNGGLGNDRVNKDFLPVEIRGILDDLQLDSVVQDSERRNEECQNQESEPSPFSRSHSPSKKKSDKVPISEDTQFILKKRHYDADEVRQYIMRQQEERKKRQSEEKKAQKEATEQKNKRLKELYKKQKEAVASKTKTTSETVTKQLQETYSKLFLEQTLLENPALSVQEVQSKPGYQPSGESDKENKAQERPVSASSSSDMSLSEPPHPLIRDNTLEPLRIHPEKLNSVAQVPCSKFVLNGALFSQLLSLDNMGILQKDFESVTSSRRSHNTAMGSMSSTPQPFMSSTVQPTINHYKHKLDRIEALKATAASLSNRIESEAKKLAGAGINYEAAWDTEHDLLQRDQGDTCRAKASSPPVREDDVFSARLQKMLATCNSHTTFDDNLPGVGNLNEFKKLPETISPHAGALGLPGNNTTEGILGNPSQKQACPAGPENKPAVLNDSGSSLSEGLLSTGFLSEEEGEKSNNPSLKIAEALNEKEFCVADKTGYEPIKEFQKEAENYLPIFTQIRNGPKPWEELVKGSPHSVINIFAKSYQLCGKESEEHAGQGPSTHRPLLPAMSPPDSIASYEDEFISSQGSGTSMDKKSTPEHSGTSSTSLKEELASKKLPYEHQTMELTHHSSRSPSSGSSRTSTSSKRRGRKEKTESLNGFPNASLREESKVSPGSDYGLEQAKHLLSSNIVSSREQEVNPDSENSLEELSGHSLMSLPDKVRSPRTISSAQSPNIQKKMDPVGNTAEKHRSLNCPRNIALGSVLNPAFSDLSIGNNRTGTSILNGSMRFSPAGLQHRMSAELNYLSTIEESVHQISDIERVRGISLAQQESVSLALILKSQQQRHERDLTLLKLKAEQELLENQRNLEEAKQKAAQAHAESLHHLAHSHQEAAETLQETTSKIATHQLETALLTADTARQIREMTELARFQISDAVGNTAAPVTTLFDQEQKHNSAFIKQLKLRNMNRKADSITTPPGKEETNDSKHHDLHAFDSYSESSRSKAHYQSSSSSRQESPSSKEAKKLSHHEKPSSSIEEEAPTAMNDSLQNNSIPSVPDERDSTSIATEYSLKFDESMTEDEIEEQSFRSLLPSESHRRINLKKRSHQVYSDEEASPEKSTLSPIKELNLPFSGGQDSFSKFTMEMVRQYMREEEMRAAHQSSLLRLREKALKEKTKAELAWLEHQKRHLRDKGEDDKMPPIRKKQRGLLLKLQQEKAEIKRLQEANKAARKERQLILKQQEEIERIRQTTMKLQEKLKSSGENKEHRSEDDKKQTHSSSPQPTDAEAYSPSSISSSDTSSIMQKLKKMRRRMDEKFLTKREQKLMQRRQHAEELLQWKQRLDAEEAEIRQIEKQALGAWEKELHKTKANKKGAGDQKSDQKETASEGDSSMPPCSCLNSESSVPEELSNLVVESAPSKVSEIQGKPGSLDQTVTEEIVYIQELESAVSPGKPSPCKSSGSLSKQESNKQTQKSGGKQLSSIKSQDISYSWSDESLSMTQSETTSDQSDIESRIWALKDEVRKKKSVVYRLKKEQKKRLKEKLKAQEASLIKQLETYDEFIKKTEEELNRDLETTPTAKPQIKTPSTATEKPKIKPPPLHRSETSKSWKSLTDSERSRGSLESIAEHIDVVPSSEQSVSVNIMKFTEAEIQSEKQSHTASAVLKTLRKSTAESDDLDSLLSSAILKDLGNTSKVSPTSLNKTEDAVSYDPQATRSIVQETAESKELEVEIASRASEISDASVFDLNQNNSISLKTEVPPETELSEKDQFVLECISVQEIKEMPGKRFKDDESIIPVKSSGRLGKDKLKGDSLISEQISICEEPSYSNDFEESFLRTDASKSEIVLTEYQRDTFYASTLSFKQDIRSQGEKSLYTRPPGSESPSFGSDDEISECLSENSLSVADSIHSERLLELKSPTEFVKNKECGNVEKVPADDGDDSSSQASSFKASSEKQEQDFLLGFSIGDRVLVSNVQPGTLKFKGRTNFAKGFWAGVELDEPEGNNNGSYNDIQYFDCKEKHGIFAPSQKISHFPESFGNELDSNENSFFNRELDNQHKTNQKGLECLEEEKNKRNSNEKSPRESSALKGLIGAGDYVKFNKSSGYMAVINTVDEFDQETGDFDSPKSSKNDNGMLPSAISNIHKEDSAIEVGEILDSSFPEKWKQQSVWQEQIENRFSPTNLEKSATPLLDLLTKERSQLEAQLKVPSQEKEDLLDRQERVGLLADSLLQGFVKDTVSQFQQIKKARNKKIHFSNQELGAVQEKLATNEQQRFLVVYELDEGEEVSSPDMCPRPESPVFGASGQEELAKRLAELELSREFLNVLGDDQDWFDEDFGLSSHTLPQNQAEESAVLPKIKLPKVSPKPYEEPLAVPYVAEEVEELVHAAAEKLWKCKELGHDLQALSNPRDMNESPQNDDIETVSKEIYKQAVFDLTREIFEEIFAEDPNLNQPLWMKPSRIISGYFRRVKDPSDLEEIKVFITTEVLKLLNLRKESNNKTDWQKMMKFGRKKKDRVDHILVQELHEEEAQWVNYDEDELYVKMQLADGIFEALIRETIDLLNQITEKQKLLLV